MHTLMLHEVIARCQLRQSQGDHPTKPAFSVEILEDAVVQLANRIQAMKIATDPDDEPTVGGPSPETPGARDA